MLERMAGLWGLQGASLFKIVEIVGKTITRLVCRILKIG